LIEPNDIVNGVWASDRVTSAVEMAEKIVGSANDAAMKALDQREALGGAEGGDLMDGMFIGSMCLIQNR
jgi:hypothetical protein